MSIRTMTPSICGALGLCGLCAWPFIARGQALPVPVSTGERGAAATADVLRQAEAIATRRDLATDAVPAWPGAPTASPVSPPRGVEPIRLYVFVSLAMPEHTLRRLAAQAARLDVPLLLRGMAGGSLATTARRAAAIIDKEPKSRFDIDPMSFRRFGISRVPAFAVAAPQPTCNKTCGGEEEPLIIVGDVSLEYALDALSREDVTGPLAAELLARLRSKP